MSFMDTLFKTLLVLVFSMSLCACGISNLKQTPEKFRFENYWKSDSMEQDLKMIFPSGTSRKKVEEILVELNHAEVVENSKAIYGEPLQSPLKMIVVYRKETLKRNIILGISLMPFSDWIITIQYDGNDKVIEIFVQ